LSAGSGDQARQRRAEARALLKLALSG